MTRRLAPALALTATIAFTAVALAADDRERLEKLNVRETVLAAEQGRNLNRLARLLTVLAQFRRDPPPALLVSPDDAVDAVRAAILVKAITPELHRRARAYSAEAVQIARQRRLAAVASEALFTADSRAAEARSETVPPGAALALRPALEAPLSAPQGLSMPTPGTVSHRFGEAMPGGGRACRKDAGWETIPVRALSGGPGRRSARRPGALVENRGETSFGKLMRRRRLFAAREA